MKILEKALTILGCAPEEVRTYLELLDFECPVTVGFLAKRMGLARASLYGFLERLHKKGLAMKSQDNSGTQTFFPAPPEKIQTMLERKNREILQAGQGLKDILPQLHERAALGGVKPRFTFFDGPQSVRHLLSDMLFYRNIETAALWPIKEMMDILGADFFRAHNIARIQNNISVRALWPLGKTVDIKNYPFMGEGPGFLREIRIVPPDIDYTMGYWVYGNKIAYLSSGRESFGFIVESAELVKTTLAQFNFIWAQSKQARARGTETENFLKEITQ